MKCAWQELLSILPLWMRAEVDRLGKTSMQELRFRKDYPPEIRLEGKSVFLERKIVEADMAFCINAASHYSPWTAQSAASGYLTAPGGHRIGLCGWAVVDNGNIRGIKQLRSLCIRVARDFPGIAEGLGNITGSVLIIGPPGSGKTTLLRDLIRNISNSGDTSVAVVDERGELFPEGIFDPGIRTDVLTGCSKADGFDMLLRTMGPGTIALDEITGEEDCDALIRAGNCGVRLLATCHGTGMEDLRQRPVYQRLMESKLFSTYIILHQDKSFRTERKMQ